MGVPVTTFRLSSKQNSPQDEQQPPTTVPVQKSKKKKKKSKNSHLGLVQSDQSPNGLSVAQSDRSPFVSDEMKGLSDNKPGSLSSGASLFGRTSDGSENKTGNLSLSDRYTGGSDETKNKMENFVNKTEGIVLFGGPTSSLSEMENKTRFLSSGTRSFHESDVKSGILSLSDRSTEMKNKMPSLSRRSSYGSNETKNKTGTLSWFDLSIDGSDEMKNKTRNLSSGTVHRSDETKNETGKLSLSDRFIDGSDEMKKNFAVSNLMKKKTLSESDTSGRSGFDEEIRGMQNFNKGIALPYRSSDGSDEIHIKTQICNMGVSLHDRSDGLHRKTRICNMGIALQDRSSNGSDEIHEKMQNFAQNDRFPYGSPIQRTVSDGLLSYRQHFFRYETNQTKPLDFQPTLAAMNSACSIARRTTASPSADVEKFFAAAEPRMVRRTLFSSTKQYGKKCSCWSFKFCSSLDKVALKTVWEWYEEPSICGIKVSSCGNGDDIYDAYFVPYISAIRIFGTDKVLVYELFETTPPAERLPFLQRIHELIEGKKTSCTTTGDPTVLYRLLLGNVHAASWYAVAWYPIYKIPDAPFRSAFLTYHSLAHFQADGDVISLPVLGLQTYNCEVNKWFIEVPKERCESLEEAAEIFSRGLLADSKHSDYEFFTARKF